MNKKISIIVPVLNESAGINKTINHLWSLKTGSGLSTEIIVVDGDPAGKTIASVKDDKVITALGKTGRARQMNCGAALANGEIILFLHADTRLPDDGLILIDVACSELALRAGAFDLSIESKGVIFRLIEKMASLRSRLTGIPYGDQAFFFSADYFRRLGGFADVPIMEDVEIMRRIKKRGDKIVFLPRFARTSARRWKKEGAIKCTIRNWLLVILYAAGMDPQKLARFYGVNEAEKIV